MGKHFPFFSQSFFSLCNLPQRKVSTQPLVINLSSPTPSNPLIKYKFLGVKVKLGSEIRYVVHTSPTPSNLLKHAQALPGGGVPRWGWGLVWLIHQTACSFLMISPKLYAIWPILFSILLQYFLVVLLILFATLGVG
jgi:hypothetical protein